MTRFSTRSEGLNMSDVSSYNFEQTEEFDSVCFCLLEFCCEKKYFNDD